jgi:alkylhydroperoxidase family enzyme
MLESLDDLEQSPLAEREKQAIRFAEKVTRSHREIAKEDIDLLRDHWEPDQIVELMCVVGIFNYLNRFSVAFGLWPTRPGEGGPEDREGAPLRE